MNKKKTTSAVAIALALVVALGGTFAWQSISQQARNEAETYKNPGGRLHNDFSGWYETGHNEGVITKDVYVENFGSQPIYARVRLDEFMEIGEGAGLMPGEDGYATKDVETLEAYARIDDVTTWKTHLPVGAVAADPAASPAVTAAPANLGNNPDEGLTGIPGHVSFHEYWTWTMGGEDTENNPYGQTVYMPTFNKNGDSLQPDVNGTMDGIYANDKSQYDDWVKYTKYVPAVTDEDGKVVTPASGSSATRVRDESKDDSDNYIVPDGAFFDADDNTVDEGDGTPANGKYGNGGIENTNYTVVGETHYAKETEAGGVCTMAEWKDFTKNQKDAHGWWVYDVDGWAYWSRPIDPDTATGLLMDRLEPKQKLLDMNEDWYYGINTVGQFITADGLGRMTGGGFYAEGAAPTEDALELLQSIGVDTSSLEIRALNYVSMLLGTGSPSYVMPGDDTAMFFATPDVGEDPEFVWTVSVNGNKYDLTDGDDAAIDAASDDGVYVDFYNPYTLAEEDKEDFGFSTCGGISIYLDETMSWSGSLTITATSQKFNGMSASMAMPVRTEVEQIEYLGENPGTSETVNIGGYTPFNVLTVKDDLEAADGSIHRAALVLLNPAMTMEDETTGVFAFDESSAAYSGSKMSNTMESKFFESVNDYAVRVKIQTRKPDTTPAETDGGIEAASFLLSEADLFGTTGGVAAEPWEYTAGEQLTAPGGSWAARSMDMDSEEGIGGPTSWWLRSPATTSGEVAVVGTDGALSSALCDTSQGIRVALWYDLGTNHAERVYVQKDGVNMNYVEPGQTYDVVPEFIDEGETLTNVTLSVTSSYGTTINASNQLVVSASEPLDSDLTITATATTTGSATLTKSVAIPVKTMSKYIDSLDAGSTDSVVIDGIEWLVVGKKSDLTDADGQTRSAALLLSKNAVGYSSPGNSRWSVSNLKKWLNGDWLNGYVKDYGGGNTEEVAGHDTVRGMAVNVEISTRQDYNNIDTRDTTTNRVFLLSEADVFGSAKMSAGTAEWWEYTINDGSANGTKVSIPSKYLTSMYYRADWDEWQECDWWLRSPGDSQSEVAEVDTYGDLGSYYTTNSNGVRPAFWYDLDEKLHVTDSSGASVANVATVKLPYGGSETFTAAYGTDEIEWTIVNDTSDGKITLDAGKVTVAEDAAVGKAMTIKATSKRDSTLTSQFKVEVRELAMGDVVQVDGIDYIMMTAPGSLTGADGYAYKKAALLLSKDIQETASSFGGNGPYWEGSVVEQYLNNSDTSGWLSGKPDTQARAIPVKLTTRRYWETSPGYMEDVTEDTIFLLSEADVFGTTAESTANANEFTCNGTQLQYFANGASPAADNPDSWNDEWWLRTPAYTTSGSVMAVSSGGELAWRNWYAGNVGLRPAFWYDLDSSARIKNSEGQNVTGTTVDILYGTTETFTAYGADDFTWSVSSDKSGGKITVNDATGEVTVDSGATIGATATVRATSNSDDTVTASFTVKVKDFAVGDTIQVDGIDYIVMTTPGSLTGADGITYSKAALLLSKDIQETANTFSGSGNSWRGSEVEKHLNDSGTDGWLSGKPDTQARAIPVELTTREYSADSPGYMEVVTEDSIFLLSQADVFGKTVNDTANTNEFTYNGAQLKYFADGASPAADNPDSYDDKWWLRTPDYNASDYVLAVDSGGGLAWENWNAGSIGLRPAFWYDMDDSARIKNSKGYNVTGKTVDVLYGATETFTAYGADDFTWSVSGDTSGGKITVDAATGAVTVDSGASGTATITATSAGDNSITASFTAKVKQMEVGDTLTIDGIEWVVLETNDRLDGVDGQSYDAALLTTTHLQTPRQYDDVNAQWSGSAIETYLNSTDGGADSDGNDLGWLDDKPTVWARSIPVEISTRAHTSADASLVTSTDKLFFLSEADVFGTSCNGTINTPALGEFTNGAGRLTYFTDTNHLGADWEEKGNVSSGYNSLWFLRSLGDYDTNVGLVDPYKQQVTSSYLTCGHYKLAYGFRPAFWYDLSSAARFLDGDGNVIKDGDKITMRAGESVQLTGYGSDYNWSLYNDAGGAFDVESSTGKVTAHVDAAVGSTATVRAYGISGSTNFTVEIRDLQVGDTVILDARTYTVVDVSSSLKDTDNKTHKAALLVSDALEDAESIYGSSPLWSLSDIRTMLNNSWLTSNSEAAAKAVEVTVQTRAEYDNRSGAPNTSNNKVFLLSQADVFGYIESGVNVTSKPETWEYTNGSAQLDYFKSVRARLMPKSWWLRNPCYDGNITAMVDAQGGSSRMGRGESYLSGVRPAFWYDLGEVS